MQVNQQTNRDKFWTDESGAKIPYSRTTGYERMLEKSCARLAKNALKLNEKLAEFKAEIRQEADKLYTAFLDENGGNRADRKGNATFFNFDRSLKIEVSINEQITFDDNLIGLAKAKLDEFIDANTSGVESFIKDLIMTAFETTRGKLDTKKVLGLKKHADRIKDKRYHEAMALIDKSIRRPESKTYFRVWIRNKDGEYDSVDLNFSSI